MAFRLAILAPTAVVCITTSIKTTRNVDAVLETLNGEVFNQHEAAEALHKEYAKTEAECTEERNKQAEAKANQQALVNEKTASITSLTDEIAGLERAIEQGNAFITKAAAGVKYMEEEKADELETGNAEVKELKVQMLAVQQAIDILGSSIDRPTNVSPVDVLLQVKGGAKIAAMLQAKSGSSEQIIDLMEGVKSKLQEEANSRSTDMTAKVNSLSENIAYLTTEIGNTKKQVEQDGTTSLTKAESLAADKLLLTSAEKALALATTALEANDHKCKAEEQAFLKEDTTRTETIEVLNKIIEALSGAETESAALVDMSLASQLVSFLQLGSMIRRSPMQDATQVISAAAQRFGSEKLSTLVTKMSSGHDAFDSVQGMISDMMESLTAEIKQMETQHMWCENQKESHTAEIEKYSTQFIDLRNGIMAKTSNQAGLGKAVVATRIAIQDTHTKMQDADAERAENHKINQEAIKKAQDGITAMQTAIELFEEGFAGQDLTGRAGLQGIDGLLGLTLSNYEDEHAATQAYEDTQQKDHQESMHQMQLALQELETENGKLTTSLADSLSAAQDDAMTLSDVYASLKTEQGLYGAVVEKCANKGLTYEERKQQREIEIESLKDALEILAEGV